MSKSVLAFKIISLQLASGMSFWGHQSVWMSCIHISVRLHQVSKVLLRP